jgi:phosphatidylglycerophosphate synthase
MLEAPIASAALPADTAGGLARRDLRGLTAETEKRLLVRIARALPRWVTPDHLTAMGAAAMAAAGLLYRLTPVTPWALVGVNACLFLNWFGDSLDGTLARVRERQRPRYGFYLDHLVDGFGAAFLCAGLGSSGLVAPPLAFGLLTTYLLFQIHIALKAHTTGVFSMSFAGVGGTELRIVLAALNTLALAASDAPWLGAATAIAIPALLSTLARDAFRTARALDREERARWN